METLQEERPWVAFLLDRAVTAVVVLSVLVCVRACWRTARANQKLALGDAADYTASERRGLLLPIRDPRA